jgi:hypothetical protein
MGSWVPDEVPVHRSQVSASPWSCAKHSPSGGAVFARRPCYPIPLMRDVGQWLCVPSFRMVCPDQACCCTASCLKTLSWRRYSARAVPVSASLPMDFHNNLISKDFPDIERLNQRLKENCLGGHSGIRESADVAKYAGRSYAPVKGGPAGG